MSPVFDEAKYRALLEKLEISILTYAEMCKNNNTYRWDSEYFLKTYLAADILIRNRNVIQLNSIASIKGGKRLPLFATFSPQGSPYIRAEDVKNNFIHWEESPKISFEVYQLIKQYQLKYNDLLLTIVGNSIGDVGICKFAISPCNFTENCVKITDNNISEYLFAFLLSRYGQIQIAREQVGTAQPKLAIERIRTFLIPQFDQQFYKAIKAVIDNARKKEEASIDCYKKSENELLAELNLMDWQPDDESMAAKTFADFQNSGRLDAEYYQPKYDEYLAKVKGYSGGVSIVANHFEQNKTTTTFSLPQYNYIEIGDINIGNGEASFNLVQTEELPANAKYVIQQGDILISKVRPYRGAVSIIDFEPQDVIASGAFTILRENGAIRKEVLSTLLRTPLYKNWLLKWNVGSSYPVIKDEDILNLTIPVIKQEIQDQIAAKVQESFTLQKESKRLLDLAKHAVEVAIEQGEESAMKLLERG